LCCTLIDANKPTDHSSDSVTSESDWCLNTNSKLSHFTKETLTYYDLLPKLQVLGETLDCDPTEFVVEKFDFSTRGNVKKSITFREGC